jgi:hypothetical protein
LELIIASPTAVATDAVGNLFFAGSKSVFKLDQKGAVTRFGRSRRRIGFYSRLRRRR